FMGEQIGGVGGEILCALAIEPAETSRGNDDVEIPTAPKMGPVLGYDSRARKRMPEQFHEAWIALQRNGACIAQNVRNHAGEHELVTDPLLGQHKYAFGCQRLAPTAGGKETRVQIGTTIDAMR